MMGDRGKESVCVGGRGVMGGVYMYTHQTVMLPLYAQLVMIVFLTIFYLHVNTSLFW